MNTLDTFTQAYIECALWSESAGTDIAEDGTVTENYDNDQSFQDHNFDVDDIAPESLAKIIEECAEFQFDNARLLSLCSHTAGHRVHDESQHGHDFWLTRNGHGAGFWDRGYRFGIGEALTRAAKSSGSRNILYSDGKIYHE